MTSDTWSPEFSAAGGRGGRHSWLTPSSGALLRAAASLLLRAGAGGRGGGQAGGRHWCPEVPEIHGFLGTLFPADLTASYKIKSQGGRQSQAWEASATCPPQRSQSRGPLLSLPDRPGASRPRGIKYHLFCILAKSVLGSVPGAGGSHRHRGPAAGRTRARRSTRRGRAWGRPAAEASWPSRSDRPGRAWVSGVRELEPFLLTLRPQTSSGQPSPLPEPLLSSPGGDRRLQQTSPPCRPRVQACPPPRQPPCRCQLHPEHSSLNPGALLPPGSAKVPLWWAHDWGHSASTPRRQSPRAHCRDTGSGRAPSPHTPPAGSALWHPADP